MNIPLNKDGINVPALVKRCENESAKTMIYIFLTFSEFIRAI